MRRVLSGPFAMTADGRGGWRLAGPPPAAATIYIRGLRGLEAMASPLEGARAATVGLDWPPTGGVDVDLALPQGRFAGRAEEVRVHAPTAELYRVLPLAQFDAGARAFWRRIFLLVRLPGGRYLLQAVARRARANR